MQGHNKILTEGPITSALAKLTWPMILGMLGMVIFNLTDTYFIGKIGVDELAAIGFTFPVIMIIVSISMGMGIGTASLISRMIVSEKKSAVRQYAAHALALSVVIIIIFVIIGQLTIEPLFRLLGASPDILPLIKDYMVIWYWGMIFLVIPMVGNNIIRATGDTFTPGMIMVFSAIVNIILDPLLIFGIGPFPELGLKGAAIATVIARGIGMIITLYILIRRKKLLAFYVPGLVEFLRTWKNILYIAGPAAISLLITPISIGVITRIIAEFGNEAVAAFGIIVRLEMLALLVIRALGSVMMIFAGQNWGLGNKTRIFKGIKIASLFSVTWGVFVFIICLFAAQVIAGIFSSNPDVIQITAGYLVIVSFSYGFQGIMMMGMGTFNGINKPFIAFSMIVIRMIGLYIPLAWFATSWIGLEGIFWSAFTANLISGAITYLFLFISCRNHSQGVNK